MGDFHCPLGVPYYEADGCILCGLCIAQTEPEMVRASKIIRSYIKKHSPPKNNFQKIAVCGKGGTGKSTFTTLLAHALAQQAYRVSVLDADESNPGLYKMFGITDPPKPIADLIKKIGETDFKIRELPAEYLACSGNITFIVSGKIIDPFQGCACELADMTSQLMRHLALEPDEKIIVDTEAGIESFGRGVERYVDTVFIMVEPSLESIEVAEKIKYMAEGIGIVMVKAVLNRVPNKPLEERMISELTNKDISYIGTIHIDPVIGETNFMGQGLEASTAAEEVNKIVRNIILNK
ncbi:P-loop NTPase [Chloroflexota bacterium]